LVEVSLGKSLQGGQIGMNIGDDDNLHKTPSL
jgi:hypothetical protein